jgi:DMSO/TMAO reductase YedYZ heme-binding membrane subunit
MSVQYQAVGWNRVKKWYDFILGGLVVLYLAVFLGVTLGRDANATTETALIRAFGTAALLLLHLVLSIGPLCRLDPRFLPLLYNRRHLGVTTFLLGLGHAGLALFQFHALGNVNPFLSLFISNQRYDSLTQFPFQSLGFAALLILFLMAATSHDFWLRNLSAPVWKRLHMLVYLAYGLLVAHVTLGALQSETSPALATVLAAGLVTVLGLHIAASCKEWKIDRARQRASQAGFVEVCAVADIPADCATVVSLGGERVAVFRYDGRISAISNACQHQNGPLGEGRIIDGCITCPWHGYQYLPGTGASPPPFKEKVPTFRVEVIAGKVLVHPQPNPPGTPVEPARAGNADSVDRSAFFVGYLPLPAPLQSFLRTVVTSLGIGAVAIGIALAMSQSPAAFVQFDYGHPRQFEGILRSRPYPALEVTRSQDASTPANAEMLLVGPGKHGADQLIADAANRPARLRGQLIHRDGASAIEVEPGSIVASASEVIPPLTSEDLGPITLTGEIVDSKCYYGVMNPGSGKVHRDCAARCLSGGIPPSFVTARAGEIYLLVSEDGQPFPHTTLREFAAEWITVRGEVLRRGAQLFLSVNPVSLRHTAKPR